MTQEYKVVYNDGKNKYAENKCVLNLKNIVKIYPLTNAWSDPDFIKAMDAILSNGHQIAETLGEADIILVGPDISTKKFNFIGPDRFGKIKVEDFVSYNNWLARTFEAY